MKNSKALFEVLDKIVGFEEIRAEARADYAAASQKLDEAFSASVEKGLDKPAGHDRLLASVMSARSKVQALEISINKARAEAVKLIDTSAWKERAAALASEIKTRQVAIDRRFAEEINSFASRHGLVVNWPVNKHMGGSIGFRCIDVDPSTLPPCPGPPVNDDKLDSLRAELQVAESFGRVAPITAIDMVLAQRRQMDRK